MFSYELLTCIYSQYFAFSVSGFEFTCESALFDLLNVMLYHGWLVDPQDKETYEVVRDYSYNQLAEMVVNCSNSEDPDEKRNGELTKFFNIPSCIMFVKTQPTYSFNGRELLELDC